MIKRIFCDETSTCRTTWSRAAVYGEADFFDEISENQESGMYKDGWWFVIQV